MVAAERKPHDFQTRPLLDQDLQDVALLLDASMGRGFWDLDTACEGSRRVATLDERLVGVASACLDARSPDVIELPGPVGIVRLVAVDPAARRRGVATRLVTEVCRECEHLGATSLLAFAWVYAPVGIAPLGGVLERLGFSRARRIEEFYATATAAECPACGVSPCVCPADIYTKTVLAAKGSY